MTPDIVEQAIDQIRQRGMVIGDGNNVDSLGTMDSARWQAFFDVMSSSGVYPLGLNWRDAFTTAFIKTNGGTE